MVTSSVSTEAAQFARQPRDSVNSSVSKEAARFTWKPTDRFKSSVSKALEKHDRAYRREYSSHGGSMITTSKRVPKVDGLRGNFEMSACNAYAGVLCCCATIAFASISSFSFG